MNQLAIGAEGGRDRGMGHVMRATSLALEAQRLGLEPALWLWGEPEALQAASRETPGIPVRQGDDLESQLEDASALVLDGPGNFDSLLSQAAERGLPSVILDRTDLVDDATWTILPVLHAEPSKDSRVRQGPSWCVVEPWLRGLRPGLQAEPRSGLLVVLGGSDPQGLTLRIARSLAKRPIPGLAPTFVIGPAAPPGRARALTELGFPEHRILRAPTRKELYQSMLQTRLAVCGFGVALYELAALGTPALHFTRSREDRAAADRLAALGIGRPLGDVDSFEPNHFEAELSTSADEPWTVRSEAGVAALGDGRGARRILELALGRTS